MNNKTIKEKFRIKCLRDLRKVLMPDDKEYNRYSKLSFYIVNIKSGIYYGYPKCCILSFLNRIILFDIDALKHKGRRKYEKPPLMSKEQENVSNYLGFIPCQKCACKVLKNKETSASLINNRICKESFPNG